MGSMECIVQVVSQILPSISQNLSQYLPNFFQYFPSLSQYFPRKIDIPPRSAVSLINRNEMHLDCQEYFPSIFFLYFLNILLASSKGVQEFSMGDIPLSASLVHCSKMQLDCPELTRSTLGCHSQPSSY